MQYVSNTQHDSISHWGFGKKADDHKYYARVETGKQTVFGTKKYRYFYSAAEYKAYMNSIDGEKNQKTLYNNTEFYDTTKATNSYNDTVAKTKKRYSDDNKSSRKPTEHERIQANEIYNKKLTDNGRKTVDETAKTRAIKKNSKQYFNLINETYELEKNQREYARKMTNIEKNRSANDERAARSTKTVEKSKSKTTQVKRSIRRKVNAVTSAAKKKLSSITKKNKDAGETAVSEYASNYYVNYNGELVRRQS